VYWSWSGAGDGWASIHFSSLVCPFAEDGIITSIIYSHQCFCPPEYLYKWLTGCGEQNHGGQSPLSEAKAVAVLKMLVSKT
jgi:hypothetical protein